ncbi:MAG: hypothetical protein MJZ34_08160 [Paludibacteraceae bacterium]|nr:hypothetical protein [Paludibacteraceae bacterium]
MKYKDLVKLEQLQTYKTLSDNTYAPKGDYLVADDITGKQDKVDMSSYYTKEQADNKFLTAHQSLEEYQKTAGMTAYALKSDIPTDLFTKESADTLYQQKGNYVSSTELNNYYTTAQADAKFLTAHQSLEEYQKTEDADAKYATKGEIPTDLFTKASADTLYISTAKEENYDSAYTHASSHTATLTFKQKDTTIGTFDGTTALEVEVGGSTPTDNGDYIYRKTDEFDGWYNITNEAQEIEGKSGVNVSSDTENKKTTISLTEEVQEKLSKMDEQLEISGGNGISITSADGKLVIASNGIANIETDSTLSGNGTTTSPLGINKDNELEISGGNGISVTTSDGKLVISSDGIATIETDTTLSGDGSSESPLGINADTQMELVEGEGISIKKNEDETQLEISVSGIATKSYYEIAKENGCEHTATINGKVVSGYAHGKGTIVDGEFMTVVGKYNLQYPEIGTLFAVGDGDETTRRNTFSVAHDSIIFGGNGSTVDGTNEHIICFGKTHDIDDCRMLTIFGEGNSATNVEYTLINGKENKFSGYLYSFMNGSNNSTKDSKYNIINGNSNSSTNMNHSIIAGNGNAVSGETSLEYSTIFGSNNRVGGISHNYINGDQNSALGQFNQVLGQSNLAIGGLNFVIGVVNSAIGDNANMLLGSGNLSTNKGCILMGNNLTSNAEMQIILGAKNDITDMVDGLYTEDSEYYSTNTGVLPMFVLAGDSKGYKNSHTVYKDGQIRLRFDNPNYGAEGVYDTDEVLLNYPYFQKQKSIGDVVVSSSGYFYEPINGTNTTIVTAFAEDGHKTFKVNVTQSMEDSPVIVTGEGNIMVQSSTDAETSKPKFTITLDDVAATEYFGDDLVGVDFETRKISATETLSAMLQKPSALYETTASETPYAQYSANKVVLDEAVIDTSVSVKNGSAYSSSNEWSKMVLPTTGEYITNDMLANGLKMMIVPPDYDVTTAPANTFIFKVKPTSTDTDTDTENT